MKVNKYFPFFILFFFFNSFLLPIGLLYTTLLAPFFFIWLHNKGKRYLVTKYVLTLLPFVIIHLKNGVDTFSYVKSFILLFTTYLTVYAFYVLVKQKNYLEDWFKKVTILNTIFTGIALIFFFTPYITTFWTIQNVSMMVEDYPRLSLLTYEPSYYSTLLVPLIAYFLLDTLLRNKWSSLIYLCLLAIPLLLSFSLGVIACLIFSFIFMALIHNRAITIKKVNLRPILYSLGIALLSFTTWMVVDSDNALALRISNVLAGKDTSGRGRTNEAFLLSYRIANEKSLTWGAGVGQIKILGEKIIRPFYKYGKEHVEVTTIPCAAAETLAIFGFVGFSIRILLQLYLFYKTRVFESSFRTLVFFHIFIYQFTGSFITNLAEYLIWILAFVPCFGQFEKSKDVRLPVAKP